MRSTTATTNRRSDLTDDELEWLLMGPFDGGIPGLVRRIRRILEVSQRGLAAILGVSQSVVARWETERTSPRADVLERMLRMAGLRTTFHDEETGTEVRPMRADGARRVDGSRFPAHGDLWVTGWWVPRSLHSTMAEYYAAKDRSRARRQPAVRCLIDPHWRAIWREVWGTPDDHPSRRQLAAEAEHLDELRQERGRRRAAA
jgi:HTH-type transcriptional regulator/antitoxin HipB